MSDDNLESAKKAARKAVEFDNLEQYKKALCYYDVAARLLDKISPTSSPGQSTRSKASEYRERISILESSIKEIEGSQSPTVDTNLQRVKFLIREALDADGDGWKDVAVLLYADAAQLALDTKKSTKDASKQEQLTNLSSRAISRAESLSGITRFSPQSLLSSLPPVPDTILESPDSPESPESPESHQQSIPSKNSVPTTPSPGPAPQNRSHPIRRGLHRGSSAHLQVSGSDSYTEEEKKTLLTTSHINDNEFVPFMRVDLSEKFSSPGLFIDRDGLLELAPKQKTDFARWARPSQLFDSPRLVLGSHVDYYSIKQTVVSDCSFVASLAVSAQYEKRLGYRLITSIIYPQNRATREPVYNPSGKYMVKLHVNGVPRKVIIDDLLPVGKDNQLLCSYSSNRGELWISLLEKAYMKVMGGYDFPGSNSNIDLHALTGWIPERWAIRSDDPDFNKNGLFKTLLERMHKGEVLVTVATGELSDPVADKTGLVPTHAYAVLDVRLINNTKLLLLKNPWSHLRWRGNYSEHDAHHWTPELKELLNYDPESASQYDNGIFWIDYESICRFFDVFYLNWNPRLFSYTYCIHQMWNAGTGPVKDAYNIGDNPQFTLEVTSRISGAIWILLTRHITDIADFRQNQEYITVLVYKNNGKRVYYPHDPPPYIDGVRINSPHYLSKIKLDPTSESRYTLVISQYEKMNTIYYTLRAYGTCQFTLKKISDPYKFEKTINDDEWKGRTAGGCANHPATYSNNPRYQLVLESGNNNNHLLVILKGPKQYQIGFEITAVDLGDPQAPTAFQSKSSGPFRSGFVYLELSEVVSGTYHVVPATFLPFQEGPFFLTCKSSCGMQLTRIQ
ncbi:calpain-7 [Fopius arisanus]|uniref:Calpain-7 n=1 Tax=Fopius arisanus TaxID=64838 RepID=A0A0C9QQ76_9HYME|nr:PREDICTED: calpain-7-like [Fopius arisanus]